MGEKVLDIELYWYETLVFGQVIHQDTDLRANKETKVLYERDGFSIRSAKGPDLYSNYFYVRGSAEEADNDVFFHRATTKQEAANLAHKIKNGVNWINTFYAQTSSGTPTKSILRKVL